MTTVKVTSTDEVAEFELHIHCTVTLDCFAWRVGLWLWVRAQNCAFARDCRLHVSVPAQHVLLSSRPSFAWPLKSIVSTDAAMTNGFLSTWEESRSESLSTESWVPGTGARALGEWRTYFETIKDGAQSPQPYKPLAWKHFFSIAHLGKGTTRSLQCWSWRCRIAGAHFDVKADPSGDLKLSLDQSTLSDMFNAWTAQSSLWLNHVFLCSLSGRESIRYTIQVRLFYCYVTFKHSLFRCCARRHWFCSRSCARLQVLGIITVLVKLKIRE